MVPVTFRIRTNVFDEDQKSYFTKIGINMNKNWKKLKSQGGAHGRVDCPFTSLAILDYPVKEFARGQEYNSKSFKGLLSAQIDIQWAALDDQGGTILPGVTSVVPIENYPIYIPIRFLCRRTPLNIMVVIGHLKMI